VTTAGAAGETLSPNGGAALHMDKLTLFGLIAVVAMLVCYALESRSTWFVLAFAFACALASVYGFLQGAWPFGLVEAVWAVVAVHRWRSKVLAAGLATAPCHTNDESARD
jgi:hypothetical protein